MRDYSLGPFHGRRDLFHRNYPLLKHVLSLQPTGSALEFGVGSGTSLRLIARHMPVVGFDSFQGLPEDWRPGFPKGRFARRPPTVANSRLVHGWFANTLPTFDFSTVGRIGLVHCDADLYSSTKTILDHVGSYLKPGVMVCFDEWHGYKGCELHEQRAWKEFAAQSDVKWEVIGHSAQAWAIKIA
jgi:hypothetical protein